MARSAIVDPMERFRFSVSWTDGGTAGSETSSLVRLGFHDIQMPKRTTTKISYREGLDGDNNQIAPGLSTMEDMVMTRGTIIQDTNGEFYKWISAVKLPSAGAVGRDALGARGKVALNLYKKDITITMLDREGNNARQWICYDAFPTHFAPGSDLNAGEDGDKSMESLTLAFEDFVEIDITTGQPKAVSSGY